MRFVPCEPNQDWPSTAIVVFRLLQKADDRFSHSVKIARLRGGLNGGLHAALEGDSVGTWKRCSNTRIYGQNGTEC